MKAAYVEVLRLHREGKSVPEMVEATSVPRRTVYRLLQKESLTPNRPAHYTSLRTEEKVPRNCGCCGTDITDRNKRVKYCSGPCGARAYASLPRRNVTCTVCKRRFKVGALVRNAKYCSKDCRNSSRRSGTVTGERNALKEIEAMWFS